MALGKQLRVENKLDHAFSINHIGHAAGKNSQRFGNAEQFPEFTLVIGNQKKRQTMVGGKSLVAFLGIIADTDNDGSVLLKHFVRIAKGAGFFCADRGFITGVKEKDNRFLSQKIGPTLSIRMISLTAVHKFLSSGRKTTG